MGDLLSYLDNLLTTYNSLNLLNDSNFNPKSFGELAQMVERPLSMREVPVLYFLPDNKNSI